jgi:hypothetical protein
MRAGAGHPWPGLDVVSPASIAFGPVVGIDDRVRAGPTSARRLDDVWPRTARILGTTCVCIGRGAIALRFQIRSLIYFAWSLRT